ncbi:MAG: DUF3397 domain-containing protein [Bacillota bacterium]|nr:DUF3397 domain-containing protein [Bacillota bacterium]MDP4170955.1 DUF3397 domain-containing protein [Bacillota bacterium]
MTTVLSFIFTALFTAPIFGYLALYFVVRVLTKNKRKSIHFASDYSTILFIVCVHFSILVIFGKSLVWYIVLAMMVISSFFVFLHWKLKGEIHYGRVFKGIWRFHFLIFFFAYIFLTLFGVIEAAIGYAGFF